MGSYKTKISFELTSDIQIPSYLRDEAAELFLNHLEKHFVEPLLKGESSLRSLLVQEKNRSVQIDHLHSLEVLGKKCPLYYKKHKPICSD